MDRRGWLGLALALLTVACGPGRAAPTPSAPASMVPAVDDDLGESFTPGCELLSEGYPENSPSGNHYVEGTSTFPQLIELSVEFPWVPSWIAGMGTADGSVWLVQGEQGEVTALHVDRTGVVSPLTDWNPQLDTLPALTRSGESAQPLVGDPLEQSPLTHPLVTPGGIAIITREGDVQVVRSGRIPGVTALPDGRLTLAESGEILVYSDPTSRYDHGALGDQIEAGSLSSLNVATGQVSWVYDPGNMAVLEGIGPIVADLGPAPGQEIVLTLSDLEMGARYVVLDERGREVARSQAIGQPYRWQHAIAVAPFGPNGEAELVGVRTPHLEAVVEFYRLDASALEIVATATGYSSHTLGSRNLDRAVAASHARRRVEDIGGGS